MRMLPLVMLAVGCTSDPDVHFLVRWQDFTATLDDDTPARIWEIDIETDASAQRDGPTRATLRVEGVAVVGDDDEYEPLHLDAVLTGGSSDDAEVWFPTPGRGTLALLDHQDLECVLGEPCTWTYTLTIERVGGVSSVGLEMTARGLVTLGYEDDAPDDAVLSVDVRETVAQDTGDTGM